MTFAKRMNRNGRPLIAHVIYRFGVGGLENGLVNLINYMPEGLYRHSIVCLTDYTDFRERIRQKDVEVIPLYKREGKDFGIHLRLWKVLQRLHPDIVHTRNLAGLEYVVTAALAGVKVRIHGEHGRDIYDLHGSNRKYILMRQGMRPFIHHYTAVSADLSNWLISTIGVAPERLTHICNGVDLRLFSPPIGQRYFQVNHGFAPRDAFVVGTVGRLEKVKDQITLVRSFLRVLDGEPHLGKKLRLVIVGDGELRGEVLNLLRTGGVEHLAWLPGERSDIPELMRGLDLFVLPSLQEGISNTILEAMASGLPVVATRVGGNPELVVHRETGLLVPPQDPIAMAEAIKSYISNPLQLVTHSHAARKRAETHFAMEKMVDKYIALYESLLKQPS